MEQHPVPQDVTGFQFRLIGDITLKQFGYLVGGVIVGYICTKLVLIPSLLRWPIGGFFVLLGVGLAFLPIEERPLDRWLMAFFKRIYSPTQYVWKKQNLPPDILLHTMPLSATPIQSPPVVLPKTPSTPFTPKPIAEKKQMSPPKPKLDEVIKSKGVPPPPKKEQVKKTVDHWSIAAPPVKSKVTPDVPLHKVSGEKIVFTEKPVSPQPVDDKEKMAQIKAKYEQTTKDLGARLASLQAELAKGAIGKDRIIEFQQVLRDLVAEKERLSKELAETRKQIAQKRTLPTEKPTQYVQPPQDIKTTVKMVSPRAAMTMGIPRLTNQANVITGIIKDSTGSLIPNMIVTVRDKEDVPVRALKTNRLGQFAASTPLANGVYFIEVEDPKKAFEFNRIEVTLDNQVLPPLEITAISQKDLTRKRLIHELFGDNPI